MERKFLEELGLEKEVIDKVLDENSRDIGRQKAKTEEESGKLDAANKTIRSLQDAVKKFDGVDVDGLNRQLADLQAKYDNDTAALRLENALDAAVSGAKAKNPKLLKLAIDRSKLKLDGDTLSGLEEQVDALRKSDPYLFEQTVVKQEGSGNPGGKAGGGGKEVTAEQFQKMTYQERYDFKVQNPELYKQIQGGK